MIVRSYHDKVRRGDVQVFVAASPVFFPFCFAQHTWFLVSDKENELHRYECMDIRNEEDPSLGYLFVDLFDPLVGMPWLPWLGWIKRFNGKILHVFEGGMAERLQSVLEDDIRSYPLKNEYGFYPGPNSNTFTQWVLDQARVDYELSWRAIGKSYSI